MAARPTVFNGETIPPVKRFSGSWTTVMRPNFPASKPIAKLKDLHLRTPLTLDGKPACTLLVPAGRYADCAAKIQAAVKARTGLALPVKTIAECKDPGAMLGDTHVITFGNMHSNPFLFRLYCRWLTLLDLKWPGPGGHALLSLHNPFGNGRNAILVGGSDDAGVAESARRLTERIAAGRELGWLHDVSLAGPKPPEPWQNDDIYFWPGVPGRAGKIGRSAACFGWNSIATYACLYYMTGREEYADWFKKLAMSRPGHVPDELREDYCYWNPANPLVETYHYYSHLIPYLWDLIEEAPVFTDEERTYITNKLVEQQDHYDPHDNFGTPNGSRHSSYQMLNIYTGSLYLAKYYPERRWFQRVANIREAFDAWRGNCTWGELDKIAWLPTSEEFVLNFFLLDDSSEGFRADGSAAEMIGPQLHCWTGKANDAVNGQQALSMLHKAAWMLKDPSWIWLARQANYDLDVFRVGQSWWPGLELSPKRPDWAVNRVSVVPLQKAYWYANRRPIPLRQGAQFAVFRSSLDESGDYVRLDLAWLCSRNEYHLATPDVVRIDGTLLIPGPGANVTVRRNGLVETGRTPKMAALTGRCGLSEGAVMAAMTPNASHSKWERILLHRTGKRTVCVDRITPREAGELEVTIDWPLLGGVGRRSPAGDAMLTRTSRADLLTVGADRFPGEGTRVHAVSDRNAQAGETVTQVSALMPTRRERHPGMHTAATNVHLLNDEACILSGPAKLGELSFAGDAAVLDPGLISAAGLTELSLGGTSLRAAKPISIVWALGRGAICVTANEPTRMQLNGDTVRLEQGTHELELRSPPALTQQIQSLLGVHGREALPAGAHAARAVLQKALWRDTPEGAVLHLPTDKAYADLGSVLDRAEAFTIEAWIDAERYISRDESERTNIACQAIVAKWQVQADQRSFMLLLARDRLAFWTSEDGGYTKLHRFGAEPALTPGWHHVAAAWDGKKVTLFVDGNVAGGGHLGNICDSGASVTLGRYLTGYPFRGDMCGVRLYDEALPPSAIAAHYAAKRNGAVPEHPAPVLALTPPPRVPSRPERKTDWRPLWQRWLPGTIGFLEVALASGRVWAGCAGGLLVVADGDGTVRRVVQLPDEITSLAVAPDATTEAKVAAVAGLDDDQVFGLDREGRILWKQKAEVHQKYWLDGHWRAPWFTDPKHCHGVLDLMFMDWSDGTPPEIVLGRACTVEFRSLDGSLIERVPLDWGDRATLGVGRGSKGDLLVTASNLRRSLGANTQAINRKHRNLGSVYHALPKDYTRIPGHAQGFRFPHLLDLDGDGSEEFSYALAGSWNDLICYDARTKRAKWARAFGTGPRDCSFMASLRIADVDADDTRAVIAAAANGWVWRFDAAGKLVWARRMDASCGDMIALPHTVAVGLDDGTVRRLTSDGTPAGRAALGQPVTRLALASNGILVATADGQLALLPGDPARSPAASADPAHNGSAVEFNGERRVLHPLPAGDDEVLFVFPIAEKDGIYRGRAVLDMKQGATLTITLGKQTLQTLAAAKPGKHEALIEPIAVLDERASLVVRLKRDATLRSVEFRRFKPSGVLKAYAGDVPPERWILCQAEECLAISTGNIQPRGGYLDGATVLHGFGKTPSRAEWDFAVPKDGRHLVLIRHAGSFDPVFAGVMIDGQYPDDDLRVLRLPPTAGWGYEEAHWSNGVPGGEEGESLAVRLTAGRHRLSLLSIRNAFNLDYVALVPLEG